MCWNFHRGWKFVQIEHVYVSIAIEVPLLHGCTSLNIIERFWTQFERHLNTFLEYGWRTGKSTDSDIFHWGCQICTNFGSEWKYQQIDLTRYTYCSLFRWQPRFWRNHGLKEPFRPILQSIRSRQAVQLWHRTLKALHAISHRSILSYG